MKRYAWLCLFLFVVLLNAAAATRKPNLLVIHTDEHNFRTLGCYRAILPKEEAFIWGDGVAVETPNIDWIAQHGALCDRFYATSPVCTPSRAAFVTGHFPQNTGAIENNLPMKDEMVTFGEVLRRNGYATGYAGKWHLDGPGRPQFTPTRKFGFEDNRYMFNRGHWKKLIQTADGPQVGSTNAKGVPNYNVAGADDKTFTTDFLADRTVEFIKAHRDQPFCFMLSIPDPHGPNTVRAPYDTMFLNLKFQQPKSALSKGENLPSYAATFVDKFNKAQMANYFGMVKCVDDNVGKILDTLRATGVLENTFVVFTSDHGDLCGEHGRYNKGVPMEGSARIAFVLYAPGVVKPGTIVRQALCTVDFKPTILSLLGVTDPDKDEGRDASRLFRDQAAAKSWKDIAFMRIGTLSGGNSWMSALNRRYKLVVAPAAMPSLFDLEKDPNELDNVFTSPAYRETVRELAKALTDYAKEHNEPLYQSTAVQADLAWAVSGKGDYMPAPRTAVRGGGKRGKKKADDE